MKMMKWMKMKMMKRGRKHKSMMIWMMIRLERIGQLSITERYLYKLSVLSNIFLCFHMQLNFMFSWDNIMC